MAGNITGIPSHQRTNLNLLKVQSKHVIYLRTSTEVNTLPLLGTHFHYSYLTN